jgi:DNA-binding XRE family transcriptional regulator
MAKFKKSDFRSARERIEALPKERLERIEQGASEILLALHLSELRKALDVTQTKLSQRAGLKQAEVSRIENNPEKVQLRTMERYVVGLGGKLKIVAEFPDGTHAEIPLHQGRPVKSRVTVETHTAPD